MGDASVGERACHTNYRRASWNSAKEPEAVAQILVLLQGATKPTPTLTLNLQKVCDTEMAWQKQETVSQRMVTVKNQLLKLVLCPSYMCCVTDGTHTSTHACYAHIDIFSLKIDFARFDKVNTQFFSIIFEGQGDGESRSVAKTHQMVANGVTWTRSVPDLPAALV